MNSKPNLSFRSCTSSLVAGLCKGSYFFCKVTTKNTTKAFQRQGWISAEAALEQFFGGRTKGEFGLGVNIWGMHCKSFHMWGALFEDASGIQCSLQWNPEIKLLNRHRKLSHWWLQPAGHRRWLGRRGSCGGRRRELEMETVWLCVGDSVTE